MNNFSVAMIAMASSATAIELETKEDWTQLTLGDVAHDMAHDKTAPWAADKESYEIGYTEGIAAAFDFVGEAFTLGQDEGEDCHDHDEYHDHEEHDEYDYDHYDTYEEYDMNAWYGCELDMYVGDYICDYATGPDCVMDAYNN